MKKGEGPQESVKKEDRSLKVNQEGRRSSKINEEGRQIRKGK